MSGELTTSRSPADTGESHVITEDGPPTKRARVRVPSANRGRHREIGLMRWRSKQDAASFVGSASGIHFIRSVYSAVEAENSRATSPVHTPDHDLVPGEEDQLPDGVDSQSPRGIWFSHEIETGQGNDMQKLPLKTLLGWSQNYFENWHPAYPFVHAPTVLQTFRVVSQTPLCHIGEVVPPFDLAVVRTIMSIALADRRQSGDITPEERMPLGLVFQSFSAAIDSVQRTLTTPTTTQTLQAVLSVQLFLISMLRYNAASRLGGLAVRMAFQIGLHRCPVRYSTFSPEDVQLRKRLFWTTYCIDRQLCQALGLPLGMRDDDLDVCYLDSERHTPANGKDYHEDSRLALLQYLVRHAEIKGLVVELCNKALSHRQTDPDAATTIVAKINKWWNDIESFLDTSQGPSRGLSTYHRITLTVLRHECTIALNRPLLAMPKDTADYKSALQSCINAARTIISTLHRSIASGVESQSSKPTILLWPSFTWAVWQSAFIVLYAAIKNELPKANASRLADQSVEVLKHIALRGSAWPNACAAAIRDLCRHLHKPPKSSKFDNAVDQQRSSQPPPSSIAAHHQRERSSMAAPETLSRDKAHARGGPESFEQLPNPMVSVPNQESYGLDNTEMAYQSTQTPTSAMSYIPQVSDYSLGYPNGFQHSADAMGNPPTGQTPATDAIFDINNVELFEGFDIPFWLDDDQYASFLGGSG